MATLEDLAKSKLDRALKKGGVIPTARTDLLAIKAADFQFDAERGKFLNANRQTPKKYVRSLRETRPEIFDALAVANVKKSTNPWRAENWNISAQGKIVRQLGLAKAAEIAKSAGVSIGATKPST